MYPQLGLLIDGEWIGASQRDTMQVTDPATGRVLGNLPIATEEDIDRAATASWGAFEKWRRMTPLERSRILVQIAAALRERVHELATVLTLEQGKPLRESVAEIAATADSFEWMAEEGRRVYGRVVPSRFAGKEQLVIHEPIGPVAAFAPWNFPAVLAGRKIATALAAGCTIVMKPAEETPGILVLIARICGDAGVPAGALNLLFGKPSQISERLIARPEIRKISFTGSIPVGRRLAILAGAELKPITLELGGHAPVIICDDADLEQAVNLSVAAKFRNAGQICNCPTRFYIQKNIFGAFIDRFASLASMLRVGNGAVPSTQMGPLIHARRAQVMRSLTEDARDCGAEIITGGDTPPDLEDSLASDSFWAPTVIACSADNVRAAKEEPFGPLAIVEPFSEIDEAIARANGTQYGLAAYAFTSSLRLAQLIQTRIESGCVSLNTFDITPPELPYGGIKHSGLGREMGSEGLLAHFQSKSIIRAA